MNNELQKDWIGRFKLVGQFLVFYPVLATMFIGTLATLPVWIIAWCITGDFVMDDVIKWWEDLFPAEVTS